MNTPSEATSWATLVEAATASLAQGGVVNARAEARWLVEEVSGIPPEDWAVESRLGATAHAVARLDALVARRVAGEPLQYVLGRWAFRTLDLLVDRRVLIPRPETEVVVDHVLAEIDRVAPLVTNRDVQVVDLGTGSGAIALSVAAERPRTSVWATDVSADALAVARANLAGIGRHGSRVTIAQGSWFDALDPSMAGAVDVVVSNPPYVALNDPSLEAQVGEWEPALALFAGVDGLDALRELLAGAPRWLAPHGACVTEIGASQADVAAELARAAGFTGVAVHPDLAGLPRTLVAHLTDPTDPGLAGGR